jgi:hypothetical protein
MAHFIRRGCRENKKVWDEESTEKIKKCGMRSLQRK